MNKKIDKEKLEKELKEIDEKLKLKKTQIENSSEYKLLETTQNELYDKKWELERKLKSLIKDIYSKYIDSPRTRWGNRHFEIKNIKSSVKQGIKKGLGVTNVSHIGEYNLKHIVKQLVGKDLEKIKTQIDKLENEIKDIQIKGDKGYEEKEKLINVLNPIRKQRKEIEKKLEGKEDYQKRKKMKEVKIKINNLPKFINKITNEVNKQLILEGLNDEKR